MEPGQWCSKEFFLMIQIFWYIHVWTLRRRTLRTTGNYTAQLQKTKWLERTWIWVAWSFRFGWFQSKCGDWLRALTDVETVTANATQKETHLYLAIQAIICSLQLSATKDTDTQFLDKGRAETHPFWSNHLVLMKLHSSNHKASIRYSTRSLGIGSSAVYRNNPKAFKWGMCTVIAT